MHQLHLDHCPRNDDQRFKLCPVSGDGGKKRGPLFASVDQNGYGSARKRGWVDNEFFMGICPCIVFSFIKIDHQCGGLPSYDRFKRRLVHIDLPWVGERAVLFHGDASDDAKRGHYADVIE
jgi:hypothetical protein